jgi:hypothetical protein
MNAIRFEKLADIDTQPGLARVAASVAGDGSLLFLWAEDAEAAAVTERVADGIGIFPKPRLDAPQRFRLSVWRDGAGTRWIDLPPLDLTFPIVDLFPDGRVLMVAPRCSWRGEGDCDLNGVVFDPATGRMDRFLLGDGINHAQVDRRGRIWVAYSDEGMFGNYGWGDSGPEPVGARGIVCFSDAGEKVWEFPEDTRLGDCGAMNVAHDAVWVCFYSEYPLVRIGRDLALQEWATGLDGCSDIAVSGMTVVLAGAYGDPPGVATLGVMDGAGGMAGQKVSLLMPDGSPVPRAALLARGDGLYAADAAAVYRARFGT